MKLQSAFSIFFSAVILCLFAFTVEAQDKEIAKVDEYIQKAKTATDPAKKADNFNKAAALIMSARLSKDQNIKLGDAYLEEGDITNAAKYYTRCDKADKNEGNVKIGHKMLETAFDDPKTEAKTVTKAISYFTKGGASAEGYEAVGDAYYAQGKGTYLKAAEYFGLAKTNSKIEKIAGELTADGKSDLAAEAYMKLNDETGYKKAGDLYYSIGDYTHAYTAYEKGGVPDGIKKYADKLYADGEKTNGDAMYTVAAEMYFAKSSSEGIIALAKASEERSSYALASTLYGKAGDTDNASKTLAWDKLFSFDFTGAKLDFEAMLNMDMAKAITANMKYLTPLKDAAFNLDDVKTNQPYISYTFDSATNKKTANPADLESFNTYYKNAVPAIVDQCYVVSANVTKIIYAPLKEAMMKRFRQYEPIKNVLDGNFGKKLQKAQVTAKDVIM